MVCENCLLKTARTTWRPERLTRELGFSKDGACVGLYCVFRKEYKKLDICNVLKNSTFHVSSILQYLGFKVGTKEGPGVAISDGAKVGTVIVGQSRDREFYKNQRLFSNDFLQKPRQVVAELFL